MSRQIKIGIIIIVFLALGFGGYFIYTKYFSVPVIEISQNENSQLIMENSATTSGKTIPKENTILPGYKLYKNSEFSFEIQYPATWTVSEENIENVRGESTKAFYFSPIGGSASGGKKSDSDLRFAILPRDGLSYGLPSNATTSQIFIGGYPGSQRKWTLPDGRRLWLLNPQFGLHNWSEDIGRIDIESSATDPEGDTVFFQEMLNSFKLIK